MSIVNIILIIFMSIINTILIVNMISLYRYIIFPFRLSNKIIIKIIIIHPILSICFYYNFFNILINNFSLININLIFFFHSIDNNC